MGPDGPVYRPTRLDAIAEAARITSATELLVEGCQSPGRRRSGRARWRSPPAFGCTEEDGNETIIEDDAFFAQQHAATRAGPFGYSASDAYRQSQLAHVSLASARWRASLLLKFLAYGKPRTACSRGVHAQPLGEISVKICAGIDTTSDGIISSQSAATLRALHQIL